MSLPLVHRLLSAALAAGVAVIAAGCSVKPPGPGAGVYVVTSPTAEFYKYGPAQSFGPDLMLKKGDRVTMLKHEWGFSKVMTVNEVAGYVASEDIDPAPITAFSRPRIASAVRRGPVRIGTPGGMSSSRQNRIRSEVMGDPSDPLFNVNDVPLPMPDDAPAGGVRPQFRTTQPTPQEAGEKPKPRFR